MDLNLILQTQIEHQQRAHSIRPVSEFGQHVREIPASPGWLSRQVAHLLYLLGSVMTALGQRLRQRHLTTTIQIASRSALQLDSPALCDETC